MAVLNQLRRLKPWLRTDFYQKLSAKKAGSVVWTFQLAFKAVTG
jgi:hypothetical protein